MKETGKERRGKKKEKEREEGGTWEKICSVEAMPSSSGASVNVAKENVRLH
jgi:hypothetical protein